MNPTLHRKVNNMLCSFLKLIVKIMPHYVSFSLNGISHHALSDPPKTSLEQESMQMNNAREQVACRRINTFSRLGFIVYIGQAYQSLLLCCGTCVR